MLELLAISEEEVRGLEALAAAELRLALHFADRAEAAEDPDVAATCARVAQKSGRGYRQMLALKVRLARELKRQAREDHADEACDHQRAVSHRKAQVHAAVKGLIWTTEREDDEAERLEDALAELLADDTLSPDFLTLPSPSSSPGSATTWTCRPVGGRNEPSSRSSARRRGPKRTRRPAV